MTTNNPTISAEPTKEKWYTIAMRDSALLRGTVLFLTWIAIWQVGRLVEYTEHASVWFPAAGFSLSCLLVLGRRAFIPIMLGAIVITIWNINHYQIPLNLEQQIWAGFLFGLAHILPYWLAASLIGKLSKNANHSAPQLIVSFLLVAGISAFIVTTMVIASLVVTKQMPISEVSSTLLPFWVGDMAGVVVLTPLLSGILIRIFPKPNVSLSEFTDEKLGSYKSLFYKVGINVVLIFATMLLAYLFESEESSFAIFFLAVTHMWIACTESPKFNVISLAISSILIILLVHWLKLMDYVMVYQFAINVIAANALFGIAVPKLKAYNLQLEKMAFTDALTQVSSRHYMEQRAQLEISRCQQQKKPLSLVVFDMDDLKHINDQYGHAEGDKALQQVSFHAKQALRKQDVIARLGGDEFVILLPGINQQEARHLVEPIRQAINATQIGNSFLSSSFGIAELEGNEDFSRIYQRADKALYVAKKRGGNRICQAANLSPEDKD